MPLSHTSYMRLWRKKNAAKVKAYRAKEQAKLREEKPHNPDGKYADWMAFWDCGRKTEAYL